MYRLLRECSADCDVHSLGILSAGMLTNPARKNTRIIRRGHSIPQAPLVAPHLSSVLRPYPSCRTSFVVGIAFGDRGRAPPLSAVVRPPLALADAAPLTRSTQLRQKARAMQVPNGTLAFFLLRARVGGPPNNSPQEKYANLTYSAVAGSLVPLGSGGSTAPAVGLVIIVFLRAPFWARFAPPSLGIGAWHR